LVDEPIVNGPVPTLDALVETIGARYCDLAERQSDIDFAGWPNIARRSHLAEDVSPVGVIDWRRIAQVVEARNIYDLFALVIASIDEIHRSVGATKELARSPDILRCRGTTIPGLTTNAFVERSGLGGALCRKGRGDEHERAKDFHGIAFGSKHCIS
jgi:hypothetical protein